MAPSRACARSARWMSYSRPARGIRRPRPRPAPQASAFRCAGSRDRAECGNTARDIWSRRLPAATRDHGSAWYLYRLTGDTATSHGPHDSTTSCATPARLGFAVWTVTKQKRTTWRVPGRNLQVFYLLYPTRRRGSDAHRATTAHHCNPGKRLPALRAASRTAMAGAAHARILSAGVKPSSPPEHCRAP